MIKFNIREYDNYNEDQVAEELEALKKLTKKYKHRRNVAFSNGAFSYADDLTTTIGEIEILKNYLQRM